jgi:dienelactone hydrolase
MLFATTLAQSPVSETPPNAFDVPKIVFPNWNLVSETDESTEYVATFPSAFSTGYKENDQVTLRVLLPGQPREKVPIVLILHYWGAPNLKVERSLALNLNERGLGAAILTLPYHLSRTPAGEVSGALAVQPDPRKLVATMKQAVMDVRRALDFLETRREAGRTIGIYGTSLGAIVSSLSFAVDPRLENAVFLLGGIDLTQMLWYSSRVATVKDDLRARGYSETSLREALREVEPANYLGQKVASRTLIIRAKFDTVVPANCTDQLVRALPRSQVLEMDTGHYGGIFIQGRLLNEAARFFEAVAQDRPYTPPAQILAPTIRVGVMSTLPGKTDVVAGLDLRKFDAKGRSYASILLTPQTPVLWIGTDLTAGLSLGVGISTRRTGFGLFWSTVL